MRAEVARLRAEVASLTRQFADYPRPDHRNWERKAAPDLTTPLPFPLALAATPSTIVEEEPSAILQLLFSSRSA